MVLTWISGSKLIRYETCLIAPFLALDSQIIYSSSDLDKASDNQITKKRKFRDDFTQKSEIDLKHSRDIIRKFTLAAPLDEIQSFLTGITFDTELPVNKRFKCI